MIPAAQAEVEACRQEGALNYWDPLREEGINGIVGSPEDIPSQTQRIRQYGEDIAVVDHDLRQAEGDPEKYADRDQDVC